MRPPTDRRPRRSYLLRGSDERPLLPLAHGARAALPPLALHDLPEEISRRRGEEQLLDGQRFWLTVAPPSVRPTEPTISTREDGSLCIRLYWRGPTDISLRVGEQMDFPVFLGVGVNSVISPTCASSSSAVLVIREPRVRIR